MPEPSPIVLNHCKQVDVGVDALMTYAFRKHESVGFDAQYQIADPDILLCVKEQCQYEHPEKMKAGWSGGDNARACFVFRALKPGQTSVMIQHLFRGELEAEQTIEVTVR